MSDSEEYEWASASDSELQDTVIEPERIVKSTELSDHLPQDDINTSINNTDEGATVLNSDAINNVDNSQTSNVKSTEEIVHSNVTASDPPPYELNSNVLEEKQISNQLDRTNIITSQKEDDIGSTPHVTEDQTETPPSSSWSSWGSNWLSKAANSVASSAHNLASKSEIGISSIVTSVESQFGIPTPESIASRDVVDITDARSDAALSLKELAQKLKEEQNDSTQVETVNILNKTSGLQGDNTEDNNNSSDKQDVQNVEEPTGFFSSYGITLTNKIVSGGLDTLENIGKKTIGLISEGDPGLRNKRAFVQEQIEIITKEKSLVTDETDINEQIDNSTILTSFHSEFEQLQGYVYLEAMEILSSECEAKQRLKMHSVSTRQREEGATPDVVELTEEMFEISFDSEIGSNQLGDLLPSCKGLVSLERVQQTVRELNECCCNFDSIDLSCDTLLPQLNLSMQLIARMSSQYIQIIKKVSELCLAQQVPVKETLSHTRELALIAYKSIDKITTRIALIEVSDDVIGNKFILDMNSGVTYIQDSFSLLRSILKHASSS